MLEGESAASGRALPGPAASGAAAGDGAAVPGNGVVADGAATTGELGEKRIVQSFSGPSRAVVTFALYRSAAKGKGLRLDGHLPEKRLFEVEALEHNTLQQIMGEETE